MLEGQLDGEYLYENLQAVDVVGAAEAVADDDDAAAAAAPELRQFRSTPLPEDLSLEHFYTQYPDSNDRKTTDAELEDFQQLESRDQL